LTGVGWRRVTGIRNNRSCWPPRRVGVVVVYGQPQTLRAGADRWAEAQRPRLSGGLLKLMVRVVGRSSVAMSESVKMSRSATSPVGRPCSYTTRLCLRTSGAGGLLAGARKARWYRDCLINAEISASCTRVLGPLGREPPRLLFLCPGCAPGWRDGSGDVQQQWLVSELGLR
jgi:hypothetical protein